MCTWLHFPFWCSFLWGVQKEKENPMSCVFLFFCFFSCVSSFLKKSVKWTTKGKVKENDFWLNFRFLTLTHNISWSFFSTSNHSEILFASPHASSQQQKQKQKQRCWIATSSRTDVSSTRMPTCLVCESSRWWTPQPCQVGWSHWIQTTKKGSQFADHFGVGSTMLTNFFKAKLFKIVQNCSDLSHASSQETEENASSFSSRNKELGNGVQKERKWRRKWFLWRKCNQACATWDSCVCVNFVLWGKRDKMNIVDLVSHVSIESHCCPFFLATEGHVASEKHIDVHNPSLPKCEKRLFAVPRCMFFWVCLLEGKDINAFPASLLQFFTIFSFFALVRPQQSTFLNAPTAGWLLVIMTGMRNPTWRNQKLSNGQTNKGQNHMPNDSRHHLSVQPLSQTNDLMIKQFLINCSPFL